MTFSHIQSALSIPETENSSGADVWKSRSLAVAHAVFSVMIPSLILTIVRHLRDILRLGDTTHKQKPTRRCRIRRLAVKDTLWYLCSTAHFLLDLQDRALSLIISDAKARSLLRQKHQLELLAHTILDILIDLVLYQDRKRALDFTEKHNHLATLRASVEPQELTAPSTLGDVQAIDYLVLDDMEYRMFLSLVERFVGLNLVTL
jgi:hypothetical protein